METERPFKLFVPPRLSSGPVSAVRPQEVVENNCFLQAFQQCVDDDYGLPFPMTSESKAIKKKNADFADHGLRKTKLVSEIEKQNLEHIGPLYSRLYEEADKIKRWKMIIDTDNRQKEKKLQENKRTMEAQRKAIQELQLENEKLSLKLEEAIKENNDLMNEGNATRHLCNLLKETCSRSAERMKKFELEREETRQFCAQNNDNIERMISAFEELCMKAENARLEMLKEESEKREQLRKEYQTELNKMENENLQLKKQFEKKDSELKQESFHYQDLRKKYDELDKMLCYHTEQLKESREKHQKLVFELEESNISLQKTKAVQENIEKELQMAQNMLAEVTGQKELNAEELKAVKASHLLETTDLQARVGTLEASLMAEQQRSEGLEKNIHNMLLEMEKKANEIEELLELRKCSECQLEELGEALMNATKFGKHMEEQIMHEKEETRKLKNELEATNAVHSNLKENMQVVLNGKQHLEKMLELLQQKLRDMEDAVVTKEKNLEIALDDKYDLEKTLESLHQKVKESEDTVQTKEEHIQALCDRKHNLDKMVEMLEKKVKDMENTAQNKEEHIQALLDGRHSLEKMVEMLQQKARDMENNVKSKEEHIHTILSEKQKIEVMLEMLQQKVKDMEDSGLSKEEHVQSLLDGKHNLDKMVEMLQRKVTDLEITAQSKENQIQELQEQLVAAARKQKGYSDNVKELKEELESEKKKNAEISTNCKKLEMEKGQDLVIADSKIRCLEIHLKASKENEETFQMEIKKLKEENSQQRQELHCLKESVKQKGESAETELLEYMEKVKTLQNEISTREKQIKVLENKYNKLKNQAETKSKSVEELQQENKSLKKKVSESNKQCSFHESEVNNLKMDLKNVKSQYEDSIKDLQNNINDKMQTEEKLLEELSKLKILADDAVKIQKETDTRCQHKITEMVALMEKHKHQYDKALEEKDAELILCKTKEQEAALANKTLEMQLSDYKSEFSSCRQNLEKITEEKERLTRDADRMKETIEKLKEENRRKNMETIIQNSSRPVLQSTPCTNSLLSSCSSAQNMKKSEVTETPSKTFTSYAAPTPNLKTYKVKTPPKSGRIQQRGKVTLGTADLTKKRKVALEFDMNSDSSEQSDLLSMLSETEVFNKPHKGNVETVHPCEMTPRKARSPSSLKSPGTVLKLAAVRRMREAGWSAITNSDWKKKNKATGKIFG